MTSFEAFVIVAYLIAVVGVVYRAWWRRSRCDELACNHRACHRCSWCDKQLCDGCNLGTDAVPYCEDCYQDVLNERFGDVWPSSPSP